MTKTFIGRTQELEKLISLHSKATPSLVVIKGRRRIGKSRLIKEFASRLPKHKLWNFAGLPPQKGISAQDQRDNFAGQMVEHFKIPLVAFLDWRNAFENLSLHVQEGDIILLDEISWMADDDPSFIPKLKVWWDQQTSHMILVLCGSISTWIEENILNSTAFFGRINLTITLDPLNIPESAKLLEASGFQGSNYDTYRLLSIFGGVPWYLEQAQRGLSADKIIKQLCFNKDGLLVLEFNMIFHDLFNGKGITYKKILDALKDGMKTLDEIRKTIDFPQSGTLSQLMEHLIIAGFIKKQNLWSLQTTKPLKQSLYRICDPYMRFYLKMIEPNRAKIDAGAFSDIEILSNIPGFDVHIGLQIEYLLVQNRPILLKSAGIFAQDVVCDGPYRQSKTLKKRGCQIDYLVQTSTKSLFIFEFKFTRYEVGSDVITEVSNKIKALKIPRGHAAIPVLYHIDGVADSVATNGYFYRIIDIADFLR
jgi:AAA+ ATPase superfamily predicted ATPase